MPLVLDASVAMAWCFADESTPYAKMVLDKLDGDSATVPSIWPLEIANTMRMGERRGRLEAVDAARFSTLLQTILIDIDDIDLDRALGSVLRLAREHSLSCYDAAYLELAMREGLPLATADARLATAARAAGVKIIEE